MKKFLSLLLAAMMLLSCATAMATAIVPDIDKVDSVINDSKHAWLDNTHVSEPSDDADIDVQVVTNYDSGENTFGKEGEAATEIWLQVDATGQIDVTVPLVLVFQTNIDGGKAISPSEYKITNHSTADLVVTKIATTKIAQTEKKQPMEMVPFKNDPLTEDQYAVRIKNIDGQSGAGKYVANEYDLFSKVDNKTVVLFENRPYDGGLFELKKAPKNENTDGAGTDTKLTVEMKTGRLSFVTSRDRVPAEMNDEKGIHLMTITYTVAIDTSDAYGEEITTAKNATKDSNVLMGDDSESEHMKIKEIIWTDAVEDHTDDDFTLSKP